MIMYSPIGGWMDIIPADVEGMKMKGWYLAGDPNYIDSGSAKHPLSAPPPGNDGSKEPPALNLEQLRIQWQGKHGTKPHHRKSAETLRKELL